MRFAGVVASEWCPRVSRSGTGAGIPTEALMQENHPAVAPGRVTQQTELSKTTSLAQEVTRMVEEHEIRIWKLPLCPPASSAASGGPETWGAPAPIHPCPSPPKAASHILPRPHVCHPLGLTTPFLMSRKSQGKSPTALPAPYPTL